MVFDVDVVDKMISPLYEDGEGIESKNFNVFIYANEVDWTNLRQVYPSYDKPIYTKSVIDLPKEDFELNV